MTGIIQEISFDGSYLAMTIKGKEKIMTSYYAKTEEELMLLKKELSLGDTILLKGAFITPNTTKNFNSFSYQKYLKQKKIFYCMQVESITRIKKNQNILLKIRMRIKMHIDSFDEAASYINTFVLGNTDQVEQEVYENFQKIGISHLFALSGTQITFLADLIQKILKKTKRTEIQRFLITFLILILYYQVIDPCAAIDRALVFYFFFSLNKIFYFHISPFYLILLSLAVLFFWHPNYIFDIGFQYATVISIGLILYSQVKKKEHRKITELFFVSGISFFCSIPISLYHFHAINPMSIIYNLFYVPYINFLVFPLAMLTLVFPFLSPVLNILTSFLENSVSLAANFSFGTFLFPRIPLIFYFLYGIFFFLLLGLKKKKIWIFLFSLLLFFHYVIPRFTLGDRMYMLDVGQGDSFLVVSEGKSMLIDTGGVLTYEKEDWEKGKEKTGGGKYIISFLSSLGISKLDFLVLTHGDADHVKEALTLLKEIPIKKIYYNEGEISSLEKEIITLGKEKKTKTEVLHQDEILSLGQFTFQALSRDLKEENASSLILLGQIDNYNLLFMGDASKKSEQEMLQEYDLPEIDILKIGHHGSRTSSSKEFVKKIKPKVGLISAGKQNRFHHPHPEVVEEYEKQGTLLFSTIEDGMVEIDFSHQKIRTYQGKELPFAKK